MTSLGRVGRILAGSIDVSIDPHANFPASITTTPSPTLAPIPTTMQQSQLTNPAQLSTEATGSTVTLVGASDYSQSGVVGTSTRVETERERQASPVQKISFNGELYI